MLSFDPFASFSEEPAPAAQPEQKPAAPAVQETTSEVASLDPFAQFDDHSEPQQAAPEPDFKVTVSEPAPHIAQPSSSFANAHQFAAPDHSAGEEPVRIPVTPIKGDTSDVPLEGANQEKKAAATSATPAAAASTSTAPAQPVVDKSALEFSGNLEKLAEGFLGESWNARYCAVKHNRFGYYNAKGDPRPKGFVYFDEANVGIPTNLTNTAEYQFAFQVSHERKNLNWFFRAANVEGRKKWLAVMSANIKHYKTINADSTILERILALSVVRDQATGEGLERSFHFYTSKTSTGWYAVILCILMELYLRKVIDVVNNDELILASNATYQGMGVYDDALDLIASKIKQNPSKSVKLAEIMPVLLYGGGIVGSLGYSLGPDAFLADPVLRAIDHATNRGTLERAGPKRWVIKNTSMEETLIQQLNSLITTPYSGTDVKDHAVIGIAYTLLRASSKSPGADQLQHDVLDRAKIFPKLSSNSQMEAALDAMAKNLGPFDKKQALLLKFIHSNITEFILGPPQPK